MVSITWKEICESLDRAEVHLFRIAKIKEIMTAWEDLFFILAGEKGYEQFPGFDDYSCFEKHMRQAFKIAWQDHLTKGTATKRPNIDPPKSILENLGELLSIKFTPPQAGKDIALHLIRLKEYYRSEFFSPIIEMSLDLSLCKLIGAVNRLYGAATARGETILTAKKAKSGKVAARQTDVLDAFYRIDLRDVRNKNLVKIAELIIDYLISKGKKPRSPRTVIRYLKSDVRLMKDLIALGVIKDKTTSVL